MRQLPENLIPTLDDFFRKNFKGQDLEDQEEAADEQEAVTPQDDDGDYEERDEVVR